MKRKVVLSSNPRPPDRSLETLMAAKRHQWRKKLFEQNYEKRTTGV